MTIYADIIKDLEVKRDILYGKIHEIIIMLNSHDVVSYIDNFPEYKDTITTHYVHNGFLIVELEHIDPYEEQLDRTSTIEIPIDLMDSSDEDILNYYITLNKDAEDKEKADEENKLRILAANLGYTLTNIKEK